MWWKLCIKEEEQTGTKKVWGLDNHKRKQVQEPSKLRIPQSCKKYSHCQCFCGWHYCQSGWRLRIWWWWSPWSWLRKLWSTFLCQWWRHRHRLWGGGGGRGGGGRSPGLVTQCNKIYLFINLVLLCTCFCCPVTLFPYLKHNKIRKKIFEYIRSFERIFEYIRM